MQKSNVVIDDVPATPAINPDMLRTLKKDDMKQAVVERFKVGMEAPAVGATPARRRSPYWQAADEEC